jgi:hypothetical protein
MGENARQMLMAVTLTAARMSKRRFHYSGTSRSWTFRRGSEPGGERESALFDLPLGRDRPVFRNDFCNHGIAGQTSSHRIKTTILIAFNINTMVFVSHGRVEH